MNPRAESLPPAGGNTALIDAIAEWLVDEALGRNSIEETFAGACERLFAVGVPVQRVTLTFATLHPQTASVLVTWKPGEGVALAEFAHDVANQSPAWKASPPYHLLTRNVTTLRRRLTGPAAMLDFPICTDLAAAGFHDYLASSVDFDTPIHAGWQYRTGAILTWATKRESGFTDADIAAILRIQRRLAVALKVAMQYQILHNVTGTYLGRDASRKVLDGAIRRGDGATINAVIFYSDLRGSTHLTETLPPDRYLALLNAYFECTAGAVHDAGGDILTFIGDAVLAVFPIGRVDVDPGDTCPIRMAALAAATDALARAAAVNAQRVADGEPDISFGIGLHVGPVVFGNIGIPQRLTFSVIGPAMNEVARLEKLSKALGHTVIASQAFASGITPPMQDLGAHDLRGVAARQTVYTCVS